MALETINPATGESLKTYPEIPIPEICAIIDKTHEEHLNWKKRPFAERAECFRKAATLLRVNDAGYAALMAKEMGKPVSQGKAEAQKCAWVCEYYADHAESFLRDEPVETENRESFVTHQPLGVILAVMPWNFPFWQVFRASAPAMMAGNGVVLKHASNVPECALTIEALFHEAGFPINIFRTLMVTSQGAAVAIVHEHVKAVTLTGSTEAGEIVAAQAGSQLKKSVMELGGSDPYIILEDADLEVAAENCTTGRMLNSGQSCIAAKRFIVVESVAEQFEKLFVEKMKQYQPGDPLGENTNLGPMARADLRDELHDQVKRSVEAGARILLGGTVPDGPGAFYPATVLTDVKPGTPAATEELFGPVAAIMRAKDEQEAIELANDTEFGLGAGVFTSDLNRGRRIAREELHAGSCVVNGFVKSDPRMPFGGIKRSGFGRELGRAGILEFVNTKSVVIN